MCNIRFNLLNNENNAEQWNICTGKPAKKYGKNTRFQNHSICRAVFDSRGKYLGMQQIRRPDTPECFWIDGKPN